MTAAMRLVAGPARATRALSLCGCLKFWSLTGTGLPQPMWAKIKRRVPRGSKWRRGLRETRPMWRAVGSPRRLATQAWAASWVVRAKRMAIIK